MTEWFDDNDVCRCILHEMRKSLGKAAVSRILLRIDGSDGQRRRLCQNDTAYNRSGTKKSRGGATMIPLKKAAGASR
jgi:hypothetical protein